MRVTFLTIILLLSHAAFGQNLVTKQDTINSLTSLIRKSGHLAIGIKNDQYVRYLFLLRLMDDHDLLNLVNDSSPCLRVYGFLGLYYIDHKKWRKIRRSLRRDSASLSVKILDAYQDSSVAASLDVLTRWSSSFSEDLAFLDTENSRELLFERAINPLR